MRKPSEKKLEKKIKKSQKCIDIFRLLCYNNIRRREVNGDGKCWCGSMAEQLICNQQVDGSTPFTSSIWERSRAAKGGRL